MIGNNCYNTRTSREKIYQELGLESLQPRRWYRKLAMFYKNYKNKSPFNRFKVIPEKTSSYPTEMLMLFLRSKLNITFSKTLSYYLQSLNGTSYNLGHNILELYNVLVQIQLTTSKAKRDI